MSLFGAKKSTFQKAKERLDKKMAEEVRSGTEASTSGIREVLDRHHAITGPFEDSEGTATTSEIAREGHEDEEKQMVEQPAAITLPREVFKQAVRIHNKEARETGHPSQVVEPVWGPAKRDKYGRPLIEEAQVHTISSDDSSSLSPPPTTSYGGSEISFPQQTPVQTPVQSTKYEGSIVAFPPSAIPVDPFSTTRASAGIIARKYIQSEENVSQYATVESEEEGMGENRKVYTPIPRKFEIRDDSDNEDDAMTEVEWREEEPYMTPTKKGKK
jgi:hypothetical protein